MLRLSRSTPRFIVVLLLLLALGIVSSAQESECTIDVQDAILALMDAQRNADEGKLYDAVMQISAVDAELGKLTEGCIEAFYKDWERYTSEDETLSFRYPEGWSLVQASELFVAIATSPTFFGNEEFDIEGQQGMIIGLINESNTEMAGMDFEEVMLSVGHDLGTDPSSDLMPTPTRFTINGRQAGRFYFEDAQAARAIIVVDYLDQELPSGLVILAMGHVDESDIWLPVVELVLNSIQYPLTDLEATESSEPVILEDLSDWHYAINMDTYLATAYQLDGEVQELTEEIDPPSLQTVAALDNGANLMIAPSSNGNPYYIVSGTQMIPVMEGYQDHFDGFPQPTMIGDILLLQTLARRPQAGIFDSRSMEFSMLNGTPNMFNCCAVSEDGRYLRYVSAETPEDDDNPQWMLRERNLETGEEQIIQELEIVRGETSFGLMSDNTGDTWLTWAPKGDRANRVFTFMLYFVDGTSRQLEESTARSRPIWQIIEGKYYRGEIPCESDCVINQYVSPDSEPVTYRGMDDVVNIITELDEDRLLGFVAGDYYIFHKTREPLYLGSRPRELISDPFSADHHWIILQDQPRDPQNYVIWDLQKERTLQVLPIDEYEQLFRLQEWQAGLLLRFSRSTATLDTETGDLMVLPAQLNEMRAIFFEILADGSLLFALDDRDPTPDVGIYRYNPITGDYVQIIQGRYYPVGTR